MRTYPADFTAKKNLLTGASPVGIFKFTAGGIDYFVSDNAFLVPAWGITTLKWVKTWGQIQEGISGTLDEFRISDFNLDILVDPDAAPNMETLTTTYPLEASTVSLYRWFLGCADPPQERFRGYVNDVTIPDETVVELAIQDESLRLERAMIGTKVTLQNYPYADPDEVGKVIPLVFGSVSKFPALAIDAGAKTSLPAAISATAASFAVSDATQLAAGMSIQVDDEQMFVSNVAGSILTVTRAYNSTVAVIHQKGAVAWQLKDEFIYVVAEHPLASIPKVYSSVGGTLLDISMVCTAWPAGNHPDWPGLAVVSVPGYITVEQAVLLAVYDGITVDNGTLDAALTGTVLKSGSASLTGNVTKTGSVTQSGTITKTGSAALSGTVGQSGSVTLSGLVALTGGVSDPGHTHLTGASIAGNTTTGLPTAQPAATQTTGTYTGGIPLYGLTLAWPAGGARSSCSYSITIQFTTAMTIHVGAMCNGSSIYYNVTTQGVGGTFTFTFDTGTINYDTIFIGIGISAPSGTNAFKVTAASRTLQATSLVSGANSASVTSSLGASNGTLGVSNSLAVGNGTLSVTDGIGVSNTIAVTDGTDVSNDLVFTDGIGVSSTLGAGVTGNVAKSGTVVLSGNSVANTLVGDQVFCDVTALNTSIASVFSQVLTAAGYPGTFQQSGTWAACYVYNGAITEYQSALYWLNELAFQARAWFKFTRGMAQLINRPDILTSVKTLATCRISDDGKRVHSRKKTTYDEILNTVNVLFSRDWTQAKGADAYKAIASGSDSVSIANYGARERADLFQFDFVTDPAMAADLLSFYLTWYAQRHWLHEFDTFLYDAEVEFGDGVTLGFAGNVIGQTLETQDAPGSSSTSDTIGMVVIV